MPVKIVLPAPNWDEIEARPFDEATDALGRKQGAISLAHLIKSLDEPCVIQLDATWGSGKTHYVRSLKALINNVLSNDKNNEINNGNENTPPPPPSAMYIDAFKDDYFESPFLMIAESIVSTANEHKVISESDINAITKTVCEISAFITNKIARPVVNVLSSGISETAITAIKNTLDFIEEDLTNNSGFDFNKIKDHRTQRACLAKEIENIGQICKNNTGFHLIIIIDELDRCRPDYALETLEQIKHFFNVKNVVFILAMHAEPLQAMISRKYGETTKGYLEKFIHLKISLPEAPHTSKLSHSEQYSDYLFKQHNFVDSAGTPIFEMQEEAPRAIFSLFNLTLREIESCYRHVALAILWSENPSFNNENHAMGKESRFKAELKNIKNLFWLLAALKLKEPSTFQGIISGKLPLKDTIPPNKSNSSSIESITKELKDTINELTRTLPNNTLTKHQAALNSEKRTADQEIQRMGKLLMIAEQI